MKVIYELDIPEDQHKLDLYQIAHDMYSALCEIQELLRGIRKEHIKLTMEELTDRLGDIIFESKINDIQ